MCVWCKYNNFATPLARYRIFLTCFAPPDEHRYERKADDAFNPNYEYFYGIVSTGTTGTRAGLSRLS